MNISIGNSDLHATVKGPPARSQMGFSVHGLSSGQFVLDSEILVSIGIGLVINGWLKQNSNDNDNNFKVWTIYKNYVLLFFENESSLF